MNQFLIILLFLLSACGGGTSGTSETGVRTQRAIIGKVSDENGAPIQNVKIEAEDNGQSARSDQFGRFSLATELSSENSKLKISSDTASEAIELPKLSDNASIVRLDIRLSGQLIEFQDLELSLESISGKECVDAFSKLQIFQLSQDSAPLLITDQIAPVRANVSCFATIKLNSRGLPLANAGALLFFLQPPKNNTQTNSVVLVSEQLTDSNGLAVFEFKPNAPASGSGYFVIEAPSILPDQERLVVVINPLRTQ